MPRTFLVGAVGINPPLAALFVWPSIPSPRGGAWQNTTVNNVMKRLDW